VRRSAVELFREDVARFRVLLTNEPEEDSLEGLKAQLAWADGKSLSASRLILEQLLPLARQGLKQAGVDASDSDLYLGTLEERVRSGQTGAQWTLQSLAAMRAQGARRRCATAPWPRWSDNYRTVGQFMSTDLFTVRPDDLVDLAANLMDWRHVRHVPVKTDAGRLVGLISHRDLLRLFARGLTRASAEPVTVRSIMKSDPVSVSPSTPTLDAVELMRAKRVGCLPVVENGLLVGIVTAQDFLDASARLFERCRSQSKSGSTCRPTSGSSRPTRRRFTRS
jgi:CBS domain-containing protein